MDPQHRIDDGGCRIRAHRASADRVIDGVDALPQAIADLVICLDARGEHIRHPMLFERGRIHDPLRQFETVGHRVEVFAFVQKIRVDARRRFRIRAGDRDRSATLRPQQTDVAREAVAPMFLARVIVDDADDEMQLDVGRG